MDLNVKCKLQTFRKNTGENLHDLKPGQVLRCDTKSTIRKSRNTLDFNKIKTICSEKDPVKLKTQGTNWEKVFLNHTSNKEALSRIYKGLSKLNSKKKTKKKNQPN